METLCDALDKVHRDKRVFRSGPLPSLKAERGVAGTAGNRWRTPIARGWVQVGIWLGPAYSELWPDRRRILEACRTARVRIIHSALMTAIRAGHYLAVR